MNYRLDRRYKKRNSAILVVIFFVLLFFLIRGGKLDFLARFFGDVAVPIWKAEVAFTDGFLRQTFSGKRDLARQNEILKSRLAEQEIELMKFSLLEEENEALKDIFLRSTGDSNMIATILSKPNRSPYGSFVIDVGSDNGVAVGDLVFAYGNVVIGEIESVDQKTAKVIPYWTPGYVSQVTLEHTGQYFSAKGRGGGAFEISFPRELSIEEGQLLLYPSLENHIVGIVEKVIFDPRDASKTVLFRSAVNIQELKWVEVKI